MAKKAPVDAVPQAEVPNSVGRFVFLLLFPLSSLPLFPSPPLNPSSSASPVASTQQPAPKPSSARPTSPGAAPAAEPAIN